MCLTLNFHYKKNKYFTEIKNFNTFTIHEHLVVIIMSFYLFRLSSCGNGILG